MWQVLFRLPIYTNWTPAGIPVYGYGLMLFVAFVLSLWVGGRLAERSGIPMERIQELALWVFLGGLIGSRVVFMIQYGVPLSHFFFIWEGGLVFYGGLLGGAVGYLLGYRTVVRRHGLSTWKLADILGVLMPLGLCLGRVGCLLNGCCYGEVASPNCPQVHFPLSGMPRQSLVERGYQTAAGFTLAERGDGTTVGAVEPGSAAAGAGVRPGDVIVGLDGGEIDSDHDLWRALGPAWPRGKNDLQLTVRRGEETVALPAFRPLTIGLHPTQVYETISTGLLFVFLLSYWPFRRRDGEVFALALMLYPVHRFLDEMLRNDTAPVALGLTLSQNGSLIVFAVGLTLFLWLRRMPAEYPSWPAAAPPAPAASA